MGSNPPALTSPAVASTAALRAHQFHQRDRIDGFHQVVVEACLHRSVAVLFLAVAVLDTILERRRERKQVSGQEPLAEERMSVLAPTP